MIDPALVARIRVWRTSPLAFIADVWKLTPQPLKAGLSPDLPAEQYKPTDFEPFQKGKHLTWQQWLIFRAVELGLAGKAPRRISVASGHGIGKSATMALLMLWFLFCFQNSQVPCTAPTSDQLKDILWKEASLWLARMPPKLRVLYEWQEQYVRVTDSPETWFARARTGKKENPEALAGVHGDHILMMADEASGVHDNIFETSQGALTNKNVFVVLISNPTRLSGFFFLTHHKLKGSWQTLQFDSSESPIVDAQFLSSIIETYGRDSTQYEIRVQGQFPQSEEDQFIPTDVFDLASKRNPVRNLHAPRVLGVDVARFGDDRTSISERQALLIRLVKERRGQDTMATVGDIMHELHQGILDGNPYDAVAVDDIGVGGGVTDRLRELQRLGEIGEGVKILAVNVAEKPYRPDEFIDRKGELWQDYKEWLAAGTIPEEYRDDTCQIKYSFDSRGRLAMEKKDDMKDRGLQSPDRAESAVLTFALKTGTRESLTAPTSAHREARRKASKQGGAWWL